jgi:DNA-binding response OmpR family regulator
MAPESHIDLRNSYSRRPNWTISTSHHETDESQILKFKNVKLKLRTHRMHVSRKQVEPSPIDIRFLGLPMQTRGDVPTREEILRRVSSPHVFVTARPGVPSMRSISTIEPCP